MKKYRHYDFEGVVLDVPMTYDAHSGIYIEEYPDFTQEPLWTGDGCPVTFAGEEACSHGVEAEPGGCPDCGSCLYYTKACEHTWIGFCRHPLLRKRE